MIKAVFLVHKRPGMDAIAFRRYWRDTHGPIAVKIPGLRKYVQNHSNQDPDGGVPAYDGFAEMWFDDRKSMNQALASPHGKAAIDDTANFLDVSTMHSFTVDEITMV